jgi:hypothetical protein
MARKSRTDMPEDYYGDGDGASDGGAASTQGDPNEQPHDTGTTAVVPSELCPGMKVGDEMVVKIVGVDDDSYEIAYAPKEGKPEEQEEAPAPAPAPEGSMQSMME